MAHFVKLDSSNIVCKVIVGREEDDGKEAEISENTGETWKQTSFNTRGGKHYNPDTGELSSDQSKAFRFNFACLGMFYDENLDAFYTKREDDIDNGFVFDETTCTYVLPIAPPEDIDELGIVTPYEWDTETKTWIEKYFN